MLRKNFTMVIKLPRCLLLLAGLFFGNGLSAQKIVHEFVSDSISGQRLVDLRTQYGNAKTIPLNYEKQILVALSYFPELKNIEIEFRLKNQPTPLTSKPQLGSMLRNAKKRHYIVTISGKNDSGFESILFHNLGFNAQIGVLGHELSHVSEFITKSFGGMAKIAFSELFSKRNVDVFESNTDRNCIRHGLGYQLLDWSITVREKLKTEYRRGVGHLRLQEKSERYLNPAAIREVMDGMELYQKKSTK